MSDIDEIAQRVFVALMQADGLEGGKQHATSLAKAAFGAAEAFIEVRDSRPGGSDVFSSAVVRRG